MRRLLFSLVNTPSDLPWSGDHAKGAKTKNFCPTFQDTLTTYAVDEVIHVRRVQSLLL